MEKKIQFLLFIAIGVLCYNQVQAQAVTYGYDASGNRISRVITLPSKAPKAAPTAEEKIYSEVLKDFSVKIYPNPTKGELMVEIEQLPEGKTASLWLYSSQGKLILQRTGLHGGSERLNISNQPTGIYLMKIATQDSSTEWKIIKN
jgi:YD repeat-containing protein